ncbi:MAG: hypothetical protein U1E10_05400 [Bdellovibrionales bacterium]|nr:hypothetical protein [Bdellovibrionales bacterium]
MKHFLRSILMLFSLLATRHSVANEVCNFSLIIKSGAIENCESIDLPDSKIKCLMTVFGTDWKIKLDKDRKRFQSASADAKSGLRLCFGRASFSVISHEVQIYRFSNEKTFRLSGIKPGTVSNIEIRSGEQACGLNENGDMILRPDDVLAKFLPLGKSFSTNGFRCQNDKEYSISDMRLLQSTVFCGFKAAKSTDFFERTTGFWHFVAENSGTLTYKETNGKTVRVKIKDGEDYHIKRPDLNPCKWEKSSKELLEPSWID